METKTNPINESPDDDDNHDLDDPPHIDNNL